MKIPKLLVISPNIRVGTSTKNILSKRLIANIKTTISIWTIKKRHRLGIIC